eukprot:6918815-Prymnesium_polylepis.1
MCGGVVDIAQARGHARQHVEHQRLSRFRVGACVDAAAGTITSDRSQIVAIEAGHLAARAVKAGICARAGACVAHPDPGQRKLCETRRETGEPRERGAHSSELPRAALAAADSRRAAARSPRASWPPRAAPRRRPRAARAAAPRTPSASRGADCAPAKQGTQRAHAPHCELKGKARGTNETPPPEDRGGKQSRPQRANRKGK